MRQIKKIVRLPLKMATVARKEHPGIAQRARMLCSLSIFVIAGATGLVTPVIAREEPLTEQGYEREELGMNPYTAPSIVRIFQQLDELKPMPFEQLQRQFPKVKSCQSGAKGSHLWRTGGRWISDCRSGEEKCGR